MSNAIAHNLHTSSGLIRLEKRHNRDRVKPHGFPSQTTVRTGQSTAVRRAGYAAHSPSS